MPYTYIFVADDDPDDRSMLCEYFSQIYPGVKLECVCDGAEALQFLRQCLSEQLPSVILLDYKMPKLSAPEILHAIRNEDRYLDIPKIVWSTSANKEHVDACMQNGADRYIIKPVDMHSLDQIVRFLYTVYRTQIGRRIKA